MNKRRILIVEDESIVAMDIQQRLVAHGYEVVGIAATGERAIELAGQHRPDLVLMDIRLQGAMDGITAAEEIRKQFHRPIVFLTAYSEEATLQRAKLVEPFGYILKPFEDRELKVVIEIALYKHQADDQIRRLNRLYLVLSRINQVIVRAPSAPELLTEVCRILVEQGGFKLAWFGSHDTGAHQILPVAQFGEPKELVQPLSSTVEASQNSPGPASSAMSEKRNFICNNITTDARASQWAPAAQAAGFGSAAAMQLFRNGAVSGMLTLYAEKHERFQRPEIQLLEEVVADVQFALEYWRKNKLQQLAEVDTRHRLKFESHIAAISMRFATSDFDAALDASLAELGQFSGVDRAFVFQLRAGGKALDNTHEWCREGESHRQAQFKNRPTSDWNWTLDSLKTGAIVKLIDTGKLPPAALADGDSLQKLAGKALLLLPLLSGNQLLGFLGFGNERMSKDWKEEDTKLLQVAADFISRILSQRHAESATRAATEQFQAFMMNAPAIVWAKDERGRYVYLNKAFEINHNVLLCNWFGKTAAEVWPPEVVPEIEENDKKVYATQMPVQFTETTNCAAGVVRQWQCTKFFFTDQHGHRYLGGIGIDVTEKQKLEVQLRQSQKMEVVGTLATGIAHDFNNLLCVVLGFGELALKKLKPSDPLYKNVNRMTDAGQRASTLVRQLLTISRKQVVELQALDLTQTVANLQKMLGRLIRADIELKYLYGAVRPVKADPGQIEQVIINLVVNARDAMPRGGQLRIETANITLKEPVAAVGSQITPGNYVVLTVSDTGSGMTGEVKARIFEPFFTTKPVGQGTGLGLAISYGIIQQSGGHIVVESAVGKGTTFRIYLPEMTETASVATGAAPQTELARGTETILLVDDDTAVREITTQMLEEAGYRVLTAATGEQALQQLQEKITEIQLIVSDVVMPKMGGQELANAGQRDHPGLKVLFTSGYSAGTAEACGALNPGVAFIQKPYTAITLSKAVRKILDKLPAIGK